MTAAPVPRHDVVVVGAGRRGMCAGVELVRAGVTDFVILERANEVGSGRHPALDRHLRLGREVVSSVFDDEADAWALTTHTGEICHARVVIAACRPPYLPWIPNIAGRNDFRGVSFHAGAWHRDFDPAGKRVAVIGGDATAGHYIPLLTESAASVKVFAHPPRRVVPRLPGPTTHARRRLRRSAVPAPREVVRSTIDTITTSGVRTGDGAHHGVDTIIYGTGFAIPDSIATLVGTGGLTIQQAWHDGIEPYLGVAVHGFPNYFLITGPDIEAQARYILECLQLMTRKAGTRIEVRRSSQQVFNERVHLRSPVPRRVVSAFDLFAAGVHDDAYDGAATLTLAGTYRQVRVRLTGHIDPIDGQYHWQGTVFDQLPADLLARGRTVNLAVGERSASARITEETPQGTHSIAGVGAPPFALDDVEFTVATENQL